MVTAANKLVDSYGRRIRKLRLSVTDACNLRCHYCMPADAKFMDEARLLQPHEYLEVVEELCELGLEEIRLTGGEPLMRKSLVAITEGLAKLPLRKIGMTTNGLFLERYLDVFADHRVQHLNISMDSLNAESFLKITRGGRLEKVLRNIELAKTKNFHVTLNVVAMRGVNDHEILDFVDFSKTHQIEVRFLELMRIGFACKDQKDQFISASEMLGRLKLHYELLPEPTAGDSTSFNYLTTCGAQIGFIASESQAFCGTCSRWRLSADGVLRACLMRNAGMSIRGKTAEERVLIYQNVLGMKPGMRPIEVAHQMNTIGG